MSKKALVIVQWSDPDYPTVANADLHEVGVLGRKGRLLWHEIFWPNNPLSYVEARTKIDAWANEHDYEIVEEKNYLGDVNLDKFG